MPHHVIAKYFTTDKRWEFINRKQDYLRAFNEINLPENTVVVLIDSQEHVIFGFCLLRGWINSAVTRSLSMGPVGTPLENVKKYFVGIKQLRLLKYTLTYEDVRMLSGDFSDWQNKGYWDGSQEDFAEIILDDCPHHISHRFVTWILAML